MPASGARVTSRPAPKAASRQTSRPPTRSRSGDSIVDLTARGARPTLPAMGITPRGVVSMHAADNPVERQVLDGGVVRLVAGRASFTFHRLRPGVVLLSASG